MISNNQQDSNTLNDDIDIGKLFGVLIDYRWGIISTIIICVLFGVGKALLSTPIYKADALLQVEKQVNGVASLVGFSEGISQESTSTTEIELLKSRLVLGQTVDNLNLTINASPNYFPYFGKGLARLQGQKSGVKVTRFESESYSQLRLVLTDAESKAIEVYSSEGELLASGTAGTVISNENIKLFVQEIAGVDSQEFTVTKLPRASVINGLINGLEIYERGSGTGIIQLSMSGEDRELITSILNDISKNYLLQNIARKTAEAENGIEFLNEQLPSVQEKLTASEDSLNQYRLANDSIDLGMEASATLQGILQLESQLNELAFKETELAKRYTRAHPSYVALLDKKQHLVNQRKLFEQQIHRLPKTQQDILRLKRDVEVNQQIYLQLLNKSQELRLVKAGTIGNVRIIDDAQAGLNPVAPRKKLIVVLSAFLGLLLGITQAFVRFALNRGVENPAEIEAIGLPVYASIPMSDWQIEINKKTSTAKLDVGQVLLAEANPADLSVEALRSLRTSLHFAMMEAKNNILMISGPSPGIGKSFVSTNMAAVIAKSGHKVLVIDADMRKGQMEKQLCTSSKSGLSEYLSGSMDVQSIIKRPGVKDLDYISRGEVPPNPSELLMHSRFSELMEWASENYDFVIIDTPPILAVTDAAIIGSHVGTTMMVGRFGQNAVKEIDVARQRFAQNGVEVKGFILNAVERKASSYYGGNYGYYNYSYD